MALYLIFHFLKSDRARMRERRVRPGKTASTWISCVKKQLSELNISWEEEKLC